MQPLQYDLQSPSVNDNSIKQAATAVRKLDVAIAMRFAAPGRKPASIYAHVNRTWQQS